MKKVILTLVVLAAACGAAMANSITFTANATNGSGTLTAQAVVTTGNGSVTVVLSNLLGGANSIHNAGQLLSDFEFTLGNTFGTVSYPTGNQGTANLIDVDGSGNVITPSSTTNLAWGLSSSGKTISLEGLGGSFTPSNLLLGLPCADGTYCNANSSIADNNPHNPFALNGASFTIDATGITSDTTITAATFSFGTTAGTNVPGMQVTPEPATYLLFATGLLGLGWFVRRRKLGTA